MSRPAYAKAPAHPGWTSRRVEPPRDRQFRAILLGCVGHYLLSAWIPISPSLIRASMARVKHHPRASRRGGAPHVDAEVVHAPQLARSGEIPLLIGAAMAVPELHRIVSPTVVAINALPVHCKQPPRRAAEPLVREPRAEAVPKVEFGSTSSCRSVHAHPAVHGSRDADHAPPESLGVLAPQLVLT
jgi:hypothetical protein